MRLWNAGHELRSSPRYESAACHWLSLGLHDEATVVAQGSARRVPPVAADTASSHSSPIASSASPKSAQCRRAASQLGTHDAPPASVANAVGRTVSFRSAARRYTHSRRRWPGGLALALGSNRCQRDRDDRHDHDRDHCQDAKPLPASPPPPLMPLRRRVPCGVHLCRHQRRERRSIDGGKPGRTSRRNKQRWLAASEAGCPDERR
jgi:hypothetical protein